MSTDAGVAPLPETLPVLNTVERRLLGVLVEKAKTTPDAYPLSLNALVTGSNQKSNREPVINLSDLQVDEGLSSLQKKGLVVKITGGRVERWRHMLYEAWKVDKTELAILAELLLRGPQTEGELRGRASRMEPIADLDALRQILKPMAERKLVVYLTPEGRRGTMLTHGFHAPEEWDRLRAKAGAAAAEADREPAPPSTPPRPRFDAEPRIEALEADLASLRAVVTDLHNTVRLLEAQVQGIKGGLGI